MKNIRKQIGEIDKEIVKLLGKRMNLAEKIAEYKKQNDIDILDESREEELLEKIKQEAIDNNLNTEFISSLYLDIFSESRKIQHNK